MYTRNCFLIHVTHKRKKLAHKYIDENEIGTVAFLSDNIISELAHVQCTYKRKPYSCIEFPSDNIISDTGTQCVFSFLHGPRKYAVSIIM